MRIAILTSIRTNQKECPSKPKSGVGLLVTRPHKFLNEGIHFRDDRAPIGKEVPDITVKRFDARTPSALDVAEAVLRAWVGVIFGRFLFQRLFKLLVDLLLFRVVGYGQLV